MRAQRLVNHYPAWSKIRVDPSSFGSRFFSIFTEALEYLDAELVQVKDEFKLLKRGLGPSFFYQIDLDVDDEMTFTYGQDGSRTPVYPTTVTGDAVELIRVDTVEELLRSPCTAYEIDSTIATATTYVWDSSRESTDTDVIDAPERLLVKVTGSTEYLVKRTTRNRFVSNRAVVVIKGLDINRNPITEHLQIPDDGTWYTQNAFSVVEEVLVEGFNGTVTVSAIHWANLKEPLRDPFRTLTTIDIEGPMCLELVVTEGGGNSSLVYKVPVYRGGSEYREGEEIVEQYETVATQQLLDDDGDPLLAVDFCIDPDTTYLVVTDSLGNLHYFDHHLGDFSPPDTEPDQVVSMSIVSFNPYPGLNTTEQLTTWFRQVTMPVLGATIKRVLPDSTTEYLQANLTWGAPAYEFLGVEGVAANESWQDFRFDVTYSQIGQWDFYITVRHNGITQTNQTSVLVDSLRATTTIPFGGGPGDEPVAVWFAHNGLLACIRGSDVIEYRELRRGVYFADANNQRLYLSDNYTSVEVTV